MKRIRQMIKNLQHDVSFFPSEFGEIPLITIRGNNQFIIENVYTLQSFSDKKISIVSAEQTIEIIGMNMKIKAMFKEELIIKGKIESIRFLE